MINRAGVDHKVLEKNSAPRCRNVDSWKKFIMILVLRVRLLLYEYEGRDIVLWRHPSSHRRSEHRRSRKLTFPDIISRETAITQWKNF